VAKAEVVQTAVVTTLAADLLMMSAPLPDSLLA
jgi:hypothetical protein